MRQAKKQAKSETFSREKIDTSLKSIQEQLPRSIDDYAEEAIEFQKAFSGIAQKLERQRLHKKNKLNMVVEELAEVLVEFAGYQRRLIEDGFVLPEILQKISENKANTIVQEEKESLIDATDERTEIVDEPLVAVLPIEATRVEGEAPSEKKQQESKEQKVSSSQANVEKQDIIIANLPKPRQLLGQSPAERYQDIGKESAYKIRPLGKR